MKYMACVHCKTNFGTRVVESRRADGLGIRTMWRRRECLNCEARWTTVEIEQGVFKWLRELWEAMRVNDAD